MSYFERVALSNLESYLFEPPTRPRAQKHDWDFEFDYQRDEALLEDLEYERFREDAALGYK